MKPKREPFLLKYFHDKVWNVRPEAHGKPMAFLIKQLRIIWIVSKNFTKDKLQVQSAGLTFYTMLSVVPLVALVFAIAKGFGLQATLEAEITKAFEGHEDVIDQVLVFATQLLENTKGGLLAGVGVVVLLWTVMQLLVNVETSFNEIWKVEQGRTLIRKLSEYFSIMLLAPIVIIIAGR